MARNRSGRIFRGGRQVRETRWLDLTPTSVALGAASTASLLFSLTTEELALRPFTVVRTRGVFHCVSDQEGADELEAVSVGFAVVSDQAIAIGVTAVPTPETDRSSDLWYVYESIINRFQFVSGAGFETNAGQTHPFDSKAMRKVEDGQDVAVVVETAATSSGAIVTLGARMLIKLH